MTKMANCLITNKNMKTLYDDLLSHREQRWQIAKLKLKLKLKL